MKTIEELQAERDYALGEFLYWVRTRDEHTAEAAQAHLSVIEWGQAVDVLSEQLIAANGEAS